jgi:DNA-binding MarR family transcriptional regulator
MKPDATTAPSASCPSGREVIAAARLFHRVLRTRLNRCFDREFALTYAQYEILQILEEEPNLHASELARRLGMTRQAANRLTERLRRADFIDLAPREGGLRVIWLTDLGTRRLATARGRSSVWSTISRGFRPERGSFSSRPWGRAGMP